MGISWTFNWIWLMLCLMLDIGRKFYALPSACPTPPHWPWGQGYGHRIFLFSEIYITSVLSKSIHISNRVYFHSITTDHRVHAMGWGWRSKYRTSCIEWICFYQMHFDFIGKARFRRATLSYDSSYVSWSVSTDQVKKDPCELRICNLNRG